MSKKLRIVEINGQKIEKSGQKYQKNGQNIKEKGQYRGQQTKIDCRSCIIYTARCTLKFIIIHFDPITVRILEIYLFDTIGTNLRRFIFL